MARIPNRHDHVHFRKEFYGPDNEPYWVYASGHRDVQPMLLCHTAGTSLDAETRDRVWRRQVGGVRRRAVFKLKQPDVHATYRSEFNAVDNFNKLALGPGTAQFAMRTMKWDRRVFFAMIAMAETNAYLAYMQNS
jgi:hypothetical protein